MPWRGEEAMNVFRLGLLPHEDHFHTAAPQDLGAVRIEHALPTGSAWGRWEPLRHRGVRTPEVETRMEQLLKLAGIDPQQGLFLADQPFVDHLHGSAYHRDSIHLAVACL